MSGKPADELPREKAIRLGIDSLTDKELLALIFCTGSVNQNVFELAEKLLKHHNGLLGLSTLTYSDLIKINGIKRGRALLMQGIFEMTRRLQLEKIDKKIMIASAENIYENFRYLFEDKEQEHFVVILINIKNIIIGYRIISIGGINFSIIHPRDIFREAIRCNAPKIAFVHNHPSGDPTPSREDIETTKNLIEIGSFLDVSVVDHIIIGNNRFASLKKIQESKKDCKN